MQNSRLQELLPVVMVEAIRRRTLRRRDTVAVFRATGLIGSQLEDFSRFRVDREMVDGPPIILSVFIIIIIINKKKL